MSRRHVKTPLYYFCLISARLSLVFFLAVGQREAEPMTEEGEGFTTDGMHLCLPSPDEYRDGDSEASSARFAREKNCIYYSDIWEHSAATQQDV